MSRTIFFAKGIGMFLVVIGHYWPNDSPEYWQLLRRIIYTFHMPLFFLLSGYLFTISSKDEHMRNYYTLVRTKFYRLIVPFISIGLLIFAIKYLAGHYFTLQHPVNIVTLIHLFINPLGSFIPLLWFVYTLFAIFIIFPLLKQIFHNDLYLLIFVYTISLFPWPSYFCLTQIFTNLPYFTFGYAVSRRFNFDGLEFMSVLNSLSLASVVYFIIYFIATYYDITGFLKVILYDMLAVCGIVFVISLSSLISKFKDNMFQNLLYTIGFYSMSIYLFHTVFTCGARIIFYQVLDISSAFFLPKAAISIILGISIPYLMEKYVLRKNQYTKILFLGLRS